MSRDYGVNNVLSSNEEIPLFYNDHPVVDRPFTLNNGESVVRGDIVYANQEGADFDAPQYAEANTGDGEMTGISVNIYQMDADSTEEVLTLTYQSISSDWDVAGSESGAISAGTDFSAGGTAGPLTATLADGATPWADGDVVTIRIYKTGSPGVWKATNQSHVTDVENVVLIAGRDTDATDGDEPTFGYVSGVFNKNAIGNWSTLVASAGEEHELIGALGKAGIHVKEGLK